MRYLPSSGLAASVDGVLTERPYTLDDLRGLTAARQFATPSGPPGADAVVDLYGRAGAVQSQSARAVFVGAAARVPGVTGEALAEAYAGYRLVRGTVMRGTVHSMTATDQPLLHAITRSSMRRTYRTTFALDDGGLEAVWSEQEAFATGEWRTAAALTQHLRDAVARAGGTWDPRLPAERNHFSYCQGAFVRRPDVEGGWERQSWSEYRTASALLGEDALPEEDDAVDAVVLRHVAWHGPVTRADLAWWSGLPLRTLDAALARVAGSLTTRPGPGDVTHYDVLDPPPPQEEMGVRLLPEFDAVLCGYDPKGGRERFVSAEHHAMLWNQANGYFLPSLLVDGVISGVWRLTGSGRSRTLHVIPFAGLRKPTKRELAEPADALGAVLGIAVREVTMHRVVRDQAALSAAVKALR